MTAPDDTGMPQSLSMQAFAVSFPSHHILSCGQLQQALVILLRR